MSTFNFRCNGRLADQGIIDEINERSPFPDGQPHICVQPGKPNANLTCRIASPEDLVRVALASEVYANKGMLIDLHILYLMGGRMDRRLSDEEPFTLKVICDLINSLELKSVSVFCPHSAVTSDLLARYSKSYFRNTESAFFDSGLTFCLNQMTGFSEVVDGEAKGTIRLFRDTSIVFPDAGASSRFMEMPLGKWFPNASFVVLEKDRDERTGVITGMSKLSGEVRKNCVIIDDLCDGGKTFEVASGVLRSNGAEKVGLTVAHGIFSKGTEINGIDCVFTTNSFKDHESNGKFGVYRF